MPRKIRKHSQEQVRIRRRLIAVISIFLAIVVLFSFRSHPSVIEKYYSQAIYPWLRNHILFVFNHIPFSAGDVVYVILLAGIFREIFISFKRIFQRLYRSAVFHFMKLLSGVGIGFVVFYLFWGLNYFREPAAVRLGLADQSYDLEELTAVSLMLIDSVNVTRTLLKEKDFDKSAAEINELAQLAITGLSRFDPPQYSVYPWVKPSILSIPVSYMGTAGYYNPFTGEAQYNNNMPGFLKPFVACHEMAHQMGFGAEDEANFIGFLAGKSSDDAALRYSAYYLAAQEFMNELWLTDSTKFKQVKARINPDVLRDMVIERKFWEKYRGSAARMSSLFYDNYLRANNQPEGLKTYNRMIRLTMAYYKRNPLLLRSVPGSSLEPVP